MQRKSLLLFGYYYVDFYYANYEYAIGWGAQVWKIQQNMEECDDCMYVLA